MYKYALLAALAVADRGTTTRYWDCGGGACGCGFGNGADPTHCHANALFKAPANNAYGATYYGGAAISQALGGGDWMSSGCGKCWKLTGTSNISGHSGKTTTIVLKGTNYCPPSNPVCANGAKHFDIAAPGFDYPGASIWNSCASKEADQAMHAPQICGYWMINSQNPDDNCNCYAINDPVLREGCLNFKSLYWNNPDVDFYEVDCPYELAQSPPCWAQNGNQWPS